MKETEILTIILSAVALVVSGGSVWVNFQSTKKQKFIDTITSQRIKWIETFREEAAELISYLQNVYQYQAVIEYDYHEGVGEFANEDPFHPRTERREEYLKWARKQMSEADDNNVKMLSLIQVMVLRLNPTEDQQLVDLLFQSKEALLTLDYTFFNASFLSKFRGCVQALIKKEWEKVKSEARFKL